jgi:hypothetical protein
MLGDRPSVPGYFALGIIFAACCVAARIVSRRSIDVGTLVAIVWGGTFPLWSSWLAMHTDRLVSTWLIDHEILERGQWSDLQTPIFVAGGGLLTAALVRVVTRSSRTGAGAAVAALVAAGVCFVPDLRLVALPVSAIAWSALIIGSLCFWAIAPFRGRSAGFCSACGHDVRELSSPVCPRCGKALVRGVAGDPLAALARAKAPPPEDPDNPFLRRNPYLN